jgi:hypothetical protein
VSGPWLIHWHKQWKGGREKCANIIPVALSSHASQNAVKVTLVLNCDLRAAPRHGKTLYIYTVIYLQPDAVNLPAFVPPSLTELRALWREHRSNEDIERLILEIQHQRQALMQMRSLVDASVREVRSISHAPVDHASPLIALQTRLVQELMRVSEAGGHLPPVRYCGKKNEVDET